MTPVHLRRRAVALALALFGASAATGYAATSGPAAPPVSAAASGALGVSPASGQSNAGATQTFTAPAACTAGSPNFLITGQGAGFDAETNLGPSSSISDPNLNTGGGTGSPVVAPVNSTWDDLYTGAGGTLPISGTLTVRLKCGNLLATTFTDTFTAQVQFTPIPGNTEKASTYSVAGGAGPTPTPTPTATPTPTPTSTVTPTPAPDEPTPTPAPDDCTANPDNPDCVDDSSDGESDDESGSDDSTTDTAGESRALPGAGAHDPTPMVLLAVMLGCAGFAVLLFEAASRPEDEWAGRGGLR